ncbi:MAG: DTW domain-containing protein [Deltaproteobacteria bacterium]|nr:DTW domain-containing protein [Deltaproteobacteria bacterium]
MSTKKKYGSQNLKIDRTDACNLCLRPTDQCICDKVEKINNHIHVLILQHPQEKLKLLNSAKLCEMTLSSSTLKTGLSWRNLSDALGFEAKPSRWGVLYLGKDAEALKAFTYIDRRKKEILPPLEVDGIIALDGSWSQAKTLWWRNSWLLKCNKIILKPEFTSLRNQAKANGLSTAEAIALALGELESVSIQNSLISQYSTLITSPNIPH